MNHLQCFPFFVEDDDSFALLLRRALVKKGVPEANIRRYCNGEDVLEDLLSTDHLRPSALLLDLELPGMSGLSVLGRIRSCRRLARLPAFMLSGREDHAFVAQACALGACGYWVKPIGTAALEEIVGGILDSLKDPGRTPIAGSLLNGR